jgi:hypothetical protein
MCLKARLYPLKDLEDAVIQTHVEVHALWRKKW